jgi:D-alanyl-lipoteichoic acid acyltransferase DltB (MBOAT superfamily)
MLFNSIDFAIFLPIVFVLYWYAANNNLKVPNLLVVIASYVFYGWWDWRFLSLIIFSTLLDFTVGLKMKNKENRTKRKILLWISIIVNLGFLGVFKYYNFFLDSFISAFTFFDKEIELTSLNIILPVGISFYTFQTLSYTIDVYKKKLEPTKDIISFAAFVSFFPQLVAGPIERATNLLPQFYTKRTLNSQSIVEGLRQILWGLFQKVVIADQCAPIVNDIFENYTSYSSPLLALGTVLFSFQIYGDFAGYSNIAIGTSKLFGFTLKRNFAYPYFSRNIAEFWRRWHISLSTWFRDYLYIPLGGSRSGRPVILIRNVLIIFVVSGFWHGANWTFIVWGALNAIYFIPLILLGRNRNHLEIVANDRSLPTLREFLAIISTFVLTSFTWIYFRSATLFDANNYIYQLISFKFNPEDFSLGMLIDILFIFVFIAILLTMEWINRKRDYPFHQDTNTNLLLRWIYYIAIGSLVLIYGNNNQSEFIYFQF